MFEDFVSYHLDTPRSAASSDMILVLTWSILHISSGKSLGPKSLEVLINPVTTDRPQ